MSVNIADKTDPEEATVEVSGDLVAVLPSAVQKTCGSFDLMMQQYINESSLVHSDHGGWYDRLELIELYTHLREKVGAQIIERVGRFLPELINWPDCVTTVSEALLSLDEWYDSLHRGHNDLIRCQILDDFHILMTLDTPYPILFERGLIRGVGHQFQGSTVHGLVVDSEITSEGVTHIKIS